MTKILDNLDIQNSMMAYAFSISDRKQHFWANFVQKIKIVSLR